MARTALCTAVYKRPDVFQKFLDCWKSLPEPPDIYVAGSEGDLCEEIALSNGCFYDQVKNAPVGAKWNHAHQMASKFDYDYFITTGSDDVMDAAMWDFYRNYSGERLALKDLYFVDLSNRSALLWNGYSEKSIHHNYPIGAHQMTRRDVMEKLQFKPFLSDRMAHENDTHKMCMKMGVKTNVVPMWFTEGIGIDIKSKGSFTPMKPWNNSEPVALSALEAKSPELFEIILR